MIAGIFGPGAPMDGMERVIVWAFICKRCQHPWLPREHKQPKVCPKCKSPYWDRHRRVPTNGEARFASPRHFGGPEVDRG